MSRPVLLMILGFVLLVVGWTLPFLMVTQIIQSTFFLNFFSYAVSTAGLILGIIGAALFVRLRNK
jgi:hypothetical protein